MRDGRKKVEQVNVRFVFAVIQAASGGCSAESARSPEERISALYVSPKRAAGTPASVAPASHSVYDLLVLSDWDHKTHETVKGTTNQVHS